MTDFPLSQYAASKKAAETLTHTYHNQYGLDVTILRYFTVYGPAGRPDMSVMRFIKWIVEGEEIHLFGDGKQSRDFTYVGDIAKGTIAGTKKLGYEIINLGSDHPVSLLEVIEIIEKITGKKAIINNLPENPLDIKATWANISKAKKYVYSTDENDFNNVESIKTPDNIPDPTLIERDLNDPAPTVSVPFRIISKDKLDNRDFNESNPPDIKTYTKQEEEPQYDYLQLLGSVFRGNPLDSCKLS